MGPEHFGSRGEVLMFTAQNAGGNVAMPHASNARASNPVNRRCGRSRLALLVVAWTAIAFAPGTAQSHTFEILYAFKGGSDGSWPNGGLAMDSAGNLYGATTSGGGSPNCTGGCGTVFRLDTSGKETVLYRFSGKADGQYPFPVILDTAGNIYGATLWGGNPDCDGYGACGVVYKLDTTGTLTVLHTFQGGSDGTNPDDALVMDAAGNLFGTTLAGGAGGGCTDYNPPGCGTVFEIAAGGQETILHAFTGGDGANPSAGLLLDSAGHLYGSALEGGSHDYGTLFELSSAGKFKVLHNFSGSGLDNGYPYDGLTADNAGNLYGTTEWHPFGAATFGTVFKFDRKTEALDTLFTFDLMDGGYPVAGLLRDPSGNLYGTTLSGGSCKNNGCGTVFELAENGAESTLHNFTVSRKGHAPQSVLVRDQAGNLYGTALDGPHQNGIVFKITP
jgi:uncharacterized repeat protein (TIGR03803 family)